MTCDNCGQYYPDDEKCCPWCNSKRGKKSYGELKAVSAELLRIENRVSAVRGLLGFAVLGAFGAAVGSTHGKRVATFSVMYTGGHTGTETVKVGSKRFRELSDLVL